MSLRLLLADDHPIVREGLTRVLTEQGFSIVGEAADGYEAVSLALEHRPDVIVMDIGMPELDGLEATRRILAERPSARILILTTHDDETMVEAARSAGARAYVVKRATVRQISDAVRTLARGETMFQNGDKEPPSSGSARVRHLDRHFSTKVPADPVLTRREAEVLQLFANGQSTVEVAKNLSISQKTVKNHLTSIYQKLDVRDRTEAVLLAVRMGIIALERRAKSRS